ncbi:MAG: hypothetical protein HY209_01000 [Candidatus Omnitrophica bacterium]|nr:hypothetical protein [Candidatus Omnitrophota bacterium]
MKAISLKIREDIFEELEKTVKEIRMSRNAYINNAVELYNKVNRKQKIRKQLRLESKMVAEESLKVAREFEGLDNHFLD